MTGSRVEMNEMLKTGDRGGARSPLSERVGSSQQRPRAGPSCLLTEPLT